MFLAEIYDDMETYEMAINCWFRYLAVCEIEALADAIRRARSLLL